MKKQLLASVCWQPGPWARYQNTFTTLIKDLGYAPGSIQNQTQLINRFAEWLRRRQTETKITANANDSVESDIHQCAAVEPMPGRRSLGFALRAMIRTVAIGIGDLVQVMLDGAGE